MQLKVRIYGSVLGRPDAPLPYNLMKSLNIFCALRKGEVFRGAVFGARQTSFRLMGEVFREHLSVLF